MKTNLTGLSIIGGSRASAGPRRFRAHEPATGKDIDPEFHSATGPEVDQAAGLAWEAFEIYAQLPGRRRQQLLEMTATRLESISEEIVDRAHRETALPVARLRGELARTCMQLRFQGAIASTNAWMDVRIDTADPSRQPLPKPEIRSCLRPVGPVAVFGASNFPLAFSVAGGDTASALAAGCPVIVKAHAAHPGTSELVGSAIQSAVRDTGLPPGLFSVLFDDGYEVGTALARHPLIKALAFTGSREGGRALAAVVATRTEPIPVYAEMGSINPLFLLRGALQTRGAEIADGLCASVTLGVGQFCTNPGLVILDSGEDAKEFTDRLIRQMSAVAPAPMLSPAISRRFGEGLKRLSSMEGVRMLASVSAESVCCGGGAALLATPAENWLAKPALQEEVFGPSTLLVECASAAQMLQVARGLNGQLTAGIHAAPHEFNRAGPLAAILEQKAGRIIFNGFPTGVEVSNAIVHGGPFPATLDSHSTSVGGRALLRFVRPVSYQSFPRELLPEPLRS